MSIDMGGPAFPTENEHQTGGHTYHFEGMSLWDYFAAAALQGLCTQPASVTNPWSDNPTERAQKAVSYADAMLAERAKRMEESK